MAAYPNKVNCYVTKKATKTRDDEQVKEDDEDDKDDKDDEDDLTSFPQSSPFNTKFMINAFMWPELSLSLNGVRPCVASHSQSVLKSESRVANVSRFIFAFGNV